VTAHYLIVALIALQRAAELVYSKRNIKRLVAAGGILTPEPVYPWIVAVHAGWLLALAFAIPADAPVQQPFLLLYLGILAARLWVMASLGPFWATRIVTIPGAPLVRKGPYKLVRHPNYVVVAAEILVAPLIFNAWIIAIVFSVLNAGVLYLRIEREDSVLAARRDRAPKP
jgi:methyltransferase